MERLRTDNKQKLTDSERHKRFLDVAKKVEASDKEGDLDNALISVSLASAKAKSRRSQKSGSE